MSDAKRRDDLRQDEWRHPAFSPHRKRSETQFQRRQRIKREQSEQPAPVPTVRVLRSVPLSSPAPSCPVCSDRPDNRDPAGCRGCARPFEVEQ